MGERKEFTCENKNELRCALLRLRHDVADKRQKAVDATERILPLLFGNVLVYISMSSELATDILISRLLENKDITIYAPYTDDNGIITPRRLIKSSMPNKLGNLPLECYGENAEAIDVCVTPLVGFNSDGYRIGYGKGCYDRYLRENRVKAIGFAYECQSSEFLPEAHDVPLDCCVTENKVIYFNHARDFGKV